MKKTNTTSAKTSTLEEFLKLRQNGNEVEDLTTGTWYSGFETVKKYALDHNCPFVAVWSNGEACTYCKKLEANFLTETFQNWMKTSNCVFWFGHSKDEEDEDRKDGKAWAKNKTLKTFPFMRFYWTNGSAVVDEAKSGNSWNKGKKDDVGAQNVIDKLEELLKTIPAQTLKVRTNPEWSKEQIADFVKTLKENEGYCPCEDEKTPDTKCMCKNFREKTSPGNCHCGLHDKYFG